MRRFSKSAAKIQFLYNESGK